MPWNADTPNVNALWGALIAEELVRLGVRHVALSPGSRSTPLVVAMVDHPALDLHLTVDERAAGFLAIGIARATRNAVAVVTTSGSAVAHLLPAAIEATLDHVPVVLLTADRPPELQDVGANQTIRQPGIFGDHVVASHSLACAGDSSAESLLSTIDAAHDAAVRLGGAVHVNCPFREPLAPTDAPLPDGVLDRLAAWSEGDRPFDRHALDETALAAETIDRSRRGLLVAGTLHDPADREAVRALAARLEWPLVADARSGLRLGDLPQRLTHFDRLHGAGRLPHFDVVIQFGARLVSKERLAFLDSAERDYRLVDPSCHELDPSRRARRIRASASAWCDTVRITGESNPLDVDLFRLDAELEASVDGAIETTGAIEPAVARLISARVDEGDPWVVGSSMPIRDVDRFALSGGAAAEIHSNRGASGIDGGIAFAAGIASGSNRPVTLLIGDLATLHDLGSLSLLTPDRPPVVVVILNNGGGNIFSFLPIADFPETFSPWFDARHDWTFAGVAQTFRLDHQAVSTASAFADAFDSARASGRSAIIEVTSDPDSNPRAHREIETILRDLST